MQKSKLIRVVTKSFPFAYVFFVFILLSQQLFTLSFNNDDFLSKYSSFHLIFRTMAPLHGEKNERVNIRINNTTANNLHRAAVTRDYIKQPRLSKTLVNYAFLSY